MLFAVSCLSYLTTVAFDEPFVRLLSRVVKWVFSIREEDLVKSRVTQYVLQKFNGVKEMTFSYSPLSDEESGLEKGLVACE